MARDVVQNWNINDLFDEVRLNLRYSGRPKQFQPIVEKVSPGSHISYSDFRDEGFGQPFDR